MTEPRRRRPRRYPEIPLSRERVLEAALRLADAEGAGAVSMRRIAQALDVEAMSLYKHVAGKEDILDGVADLVMAEVPVPSPDTPWREALRSAAMATHAALLRHPWAAPVLESRKTPGPRRNDYLEAVVGILRGAGFPLQDVARAFMAIDAHVYGFTVMELSFPFDLRTDAAAAEEMVRAIFAAGYPNLSSMAGLAITGPGVPIELEFGLDLLLDGLERHLSAITIRGGA